MNPEILADYGLAGLVIAGLFFTLKNLITIGLEKLEVLTARYAEDFRRIQDEHRNERTEWRESEERRHEKLDSTIIGLTNAIHEQNTRRRDTDR